MTKPKEITQKTFQPFLLSVLGELTQYTAGVIVPFTDTYKPVCDAMGITEDEYGQCDSHDCPWTHRLIGLAFRTLRNKGLGFSDKKGLWTLTVMGAQSAREGLEVPPEPAGDSNAGPIHVAARTMTFEPVTPVIRLPTAHPYHNDPYIRGMAISQTPCFGAFSVRSETCKTCPLALECGNAALAAKAKIAADMEAADIKKEAAEAAKLRAKLEKNAGIDDLISSFDEDTAKEPKPTPTTGTSKGLPSKATAQRDGICSRCNTPIKKGTACLWIKGEGIIHNHCGTP